MKAISRLDCPEVSITSEKSQAVHVSQEETSCLNYSDWTKRLTRQYSTQRSIKSSNRLKDMKGGQPSVPARL